MPFNTLSVASAVTPSVIETYFSHYLNRGPLRQKPTAHISYHEGLRLIRQFLDYSSKHSVEELQGFTAQWVPAPTWVRIQDSEIAPKFLVRAVQVLHAQLGYQGLEKVGGRTWWQWRRPEAPLRAEWIEMKKDFNARKRAGTQCERVILYIHGGAYYFGSVDEHRYQMQRHARKLKARVLAPRYRLAPEFPFPCGLYDCIATYFYLLEHFKPNQILFAGDSAGGGMVLSLLVTLRDQGCPLPAGTILLSPWVDLTHSFPSVAGDGLGDYIPPHGFHHKPSLAWPPPPSDEIKKPVKKYEQPPADAIELPATAGLDMKKTKRRKDGIEDDDDEEADAKVARKAQATNAIPGIDDNLSIMLDGKKIEMKDQIQLYATNEQLSHPLVSPVMQPTLGGLPPMLIQVGGAELLRDEQIYLAHKAANPKAFPPSDAVLDEYDPRREYLNRYPPTDVQLQVWEDLCHVPHTLSFTRPAKYMYRSVAQFGAWALAHAQHKGIDIQNDDAISIISSGDEEGEDANASSTDWRRNNTNGRLELNGDASSSKLALGAVGKAGDSLPPFKDHMIRQRVTRHGMIYPMASQAEIACLALDPASIGAIKPGPVRKWLAKRRENEPKFANERKKVQKKRAREAAAGYDSIPGETPPPTALVGRRRKGVAPEEKKKSKSWGLAMWSGWGSHHDGCTLEREDQLEKDARQSSAAEKAGQPQSQNAPSSSNLTVPGQAGGEAAKKQRRTSSASIFSAPWNKADKERPRSPYRQVTDTGQAGPGEGSAQPGSASVRTPYSRRSSGSLSTFASRPVSMAVPTAGALAPDSVQVPGSQNTYLNADNPRPHNGIMAYPFRLRNPVSNPSITTLDSQAISMMSNSDERAGPIEMPTPADERRPVNDDPLSRAAGPATINSTPAFASAAGARSSTPQTPDEAISPAESLIGAPFKTSDPVFRGRTSILGATGADGMPTGPLVAPIFKVDKPSEPSSVAAAWETLPKIADSTPVSPIDGSKNAPFKMRNPVFDPRAATPVGQLGHESPVAAAAQSPLSALTSGETQDAPKTAPFKMRHTVIDPHIAPGLAMKQFPDSPAEIAKPLLPKQPSPLTEAEKIVDRAMTPVTPPSTSNLPPNSHIVMPTVVPRRPFVMRAATPPPPPPPKNEARKVGSLDRKHSAGDLLAKSKFSANAPMIGDLGFENTGFEGLGAEQEGDMKRAQV